MPRALALLLLVGCGASEPVLPTTAFQMTTTPVSAGGILTLSVTLPAPATRDLEVRFYGSLAGEGAEPCTHGVCGGLDEPVALGTAHFFPKQQVTSVDATTPPDAAAGSPIWMQAVVSTSDGAVVSDVLATTVGAAPAATKPTRAPAEAPEARPRTQTEAPVNCDEKRGQAAIAGCRAHQTGDLTLCEDIPLRDDRLFCFALARQSVGGCRQIVDKDLRERCLGDIEGTAPAAAEEAHGDPSQPTGSAITLADCDKETSPDWSIVCKARNTGSVDLCAKAQNHDAKLFCYGVLRRSRGSCLQVMNEAREAECLAAIGSR